MWTSHELYWLVHGPYGVFENFPLLRSVELLPEFLEGEVWDFFGRLEVQTSEDAGFNTSKCLILRVNPVESTL